MRNTEAKTVSVAYLQETVGDAAIVFTVKDLFGFTLSREMKVSYTGELKLDVSKPPTSYGGYAVPFTVQIQKEGYKGNFIINTVRKEGDAMVQYKGNPVDNISLPAGKYDFIIAPLSPICEYGIFAGKTADDPSGITVPIDLLVQPRIIKLQLSYSNTGNNSSNIYLRASDAPLSDITVECEIQTTVLRNNVWVKGEKRKLSFTITATNYIQQTVLTATGSDKGLKIASPTDARIISQSKYNDANYLVIYEAENPH